MNKLFLIGNGFDLAHDLKTRYTDFIVWYLSKVFSKSESTTTHPFQYEDGLMWMRHSSYNNVPIIKFTSIQHFKDEMNNYKIDYEFKPTFFKTLINSAHEYNWVDIESHYYDALTKLYLKINEKGDSIKQSIIDNDLKPLNSCLDLIKNELIEYLQTVEINKYDKDIGQHFQNELFKFRQENNYLPDHEVGEIHVLNFNYTSTIENYINNNLTMLDPYIDGYSNSKKVNWNINYIHGSLKDIENNPIIFGYGDESDSYYEKIELLKSNEFLDHIKAFRYMKVGNYRNLLKFIELPNKFDVFIMGHSCGLSDRLLLNSIFESEKCNSIKIFYHQKGQDKNENDFFPKTQEISRHFITEKNKVRMRALMVPENECDALTSFKK